jgi:hypothetical protein
LPAHFEAAADLAGPIVHRVQPDPASAARILRQPGAIVLDAQPAFAIVEPQADFDPIGSSVGNRVAHGLLRDAKQVRLGLGGKRGAVTVDQGARNAKEEPDADKPGFPARRRDRRR